MKAADLDDRRVLEAIREDKTPIGAQFRKIQRQFPEVPAKILRAKLHALIRRRLIDGCVCGCRGDYRLRQLAVERYFND